MNEIKRFWNDTAFLTREWAWSYVAIPLTCGLFILTLILGAFYQYWAIAVLLIVFTVHSFLWKYGLWNVWRKYHHYKRLSNEERRKYFFILFTTIVEGERYLWLKDYCSRHEIAIKDLPTILEFIPEDIIFHYLTDHEQLTLEHFILYGQPPALTREINYASLESEYPQIFNRCSCLLEDEEFRRHLKLFGYNYLIKSKQIYNPSI